MIPKTLADFRKSLGDGIHAHLHRREGDEFKTGFWYGQVDREFPDLDLEQEFDILIKANP